MRLERLVRAAQTSDIAPAKQNQPRVTIIPSAPITLVWGKGGNVKQISGSFQETLSLYAIRRPKERAI